MVCLMLFLMLLMLLLMLLLIMILLLLMLLLMLLMLTLPRMLLLLLPYCSRFVWFGMPASDGAPVVRHGGAAERWRRPAQAEDREGSKGLLARTGVCHSILPLPSCLFHPSSPMVPLASYLFHRTCGLWDARRARSGAVVTFRTCDDVDWVTCSRLPPEVFTNAERGFSRNVTRLIQRGGLSNCWAAMLHSMEQT